MKNQKIPIKGHYIFIDIKTTGIRPTLDKITAIHIQHIKNSKIIINRSISIDPKNTFSTIAKQLYTLLKGKTFVAHDARFTYAFIKNALKTCEYHLNEKILCTLRLSRMLFPDLKNHRIADLKQHLALDPQVTNAEFLLTFFHHLTTLLTPNDLTHTIELLQKYPSMPSALSLHHTKNIPNTPGVYRFYGKNDELLYVSKSLTLRDSIFTHFIPERSTKKLPQLSQQIKKIDWIKTVGECGAFLLEAKIIKNATPLFNQLQGRNTSLFTIKAVTTKQHYITLEAINLAQVTTSHIENIYGIFNSRQAAEAKLKHFINENNLCYSINQFGKTMKPCFRYQIHKCIGACAHAETNESYNLRITPNLKNLGPNPWPFESKIAIQEICPKNKDKMEFHIIDKWRYLGSYEKIHDATNVSDPTSKIDVETFNIIRQFISKRLDYINLIQC